MSVSGDNTPFASGRPPPLPGENRQTPAHIRRHWPTWAKITTSLAIAVVVTLLALFFIAPPIAKSVLEKQLTKNLSTPQQPREAHIEKVRINPFALSATIEGLNVTAPGREPLVAWRRLYASLDLRTLVSHPWRFREIALDGFSGRIAVGKDGKLNFADLLASAQPQPQPTPDKTQKKPPALHVNQLVVTDARVDYSDDALPRPFATVIGPTNFTVHDFHTGDPDRAPGIFSATTESGEKLSWEGALSVAPLSSRGELRIGNLTAKKYAPFYGHHVRFDVTDGSIDLVLRYEVSMQGDKLALRASESSLIIHAVKLIERGQDAPAVTVETIELAGISFENENRLTAETQPPGELVATPVDNPQKKQHLQIDRITLDNGAVAVRRDAHGISLAELFTPVDQTAAAQPTGDAKPPGQLASTSNEPPASAQPAQKQNTPRPRTFDVTVGEITANNFAIAFEDTTLPQPLKNTSTITKFTAKNFSLDALDKPLALELVAQISESGQLRATGEIAISPLNGHIDAELATLPLASANPYVEQFANARIDKGTLTAKTAVAIDPTSGITINGDASIADLGVTDTVSNEPVQAWRRFEVRAFSFASAPAAKLAIGEVALDGSTTQVIVSTDGKLNLTALRKNSANADESTATPPAETTQNKDSNAKLFVTIGKVTLTDSRVDFSDHSIQPQVKMSLGEINGTVSGLSSENLAHAVVDVRAKINGAAPVALTGEINPLSNDVYSDLKFTLRSAELKPLESYSAKYAGRTVARGTLNADITTKVSNRFLDSANVITLDQFEFGEQTNSPDATKLPVGLAVSLLRDTQGKIVLDVPIKGSLDDPDFRYGRAVWRAIGNLLVKAATAPFTLLTSIIGIGGGGGGGTSAAPGAVVATDAPTGAPPTGSAEDLSKAVFAAGAASPSDAVTQKLALIAKALRERPALKLSLSGGFDSGGDSAALKNDALVKQLKQEYLSEIGGASGEKTVAAAEHVEITPETETRLVERLYQRKFRVEERTNLNAVTAPARLTAEVVPPKSFEKMEGEFVAGGKISNGRRSITITRVPIVRPSVSGEPATENAVASATTRPRASTGESAPVATAPAEPLPPHGEMRAKLLDSISVSEEQLRLLASVRAEAVKEYLVTEGGLAPERVEIVPPSSTGALVAMELR